MMRMVYLTVVGLVLGGVIHILTVLLIPSYASKDAWATLASQGKAWETFVVSLPGADSETKLASTDPSFGIAACRFNLGESPLMVRTEGFLPFWSVALFDRQGRNSYSFNDRTAIERKLFLLVVNPVQMAQLRRNPPEEAERAVLVESDIQEGFVLIRAFQDMPSRAEAVREFLSKTSCEKYVFPDLEGSEPTTEN